MKKCQLCFEDNPQDAITCKRCGESFHKTDRMATADPEMPWCFRKTAIFLAVGSFGPLALPLIWFRPRTSLAWKIGLTIVIGLASWYLFKVATDAINSLKDYSTVLDMLR